MKYITIAVVILLLSVTFAMAGPQYALDVNEQMTITRDVPGVLSSNISVRLHYAGWVNGFVFSIVHHDLHNSWNTYHNIAKTRRIHLGQGVFVRVIRNEPTKLVVELEE
jgi:hypothetical protein